MPKYTDGVELPSNCIRCSEGPGIWPSNMGRWFYCQDILFGDYVSSYNRSNYRVFKEQFASGEDSWWVATGGTILIRTLAYRNSQEVRETIDGLADYPILDEGDLSELEQEDEQGQWLDWAEQDFYRELERVWNNALENINLPLNAVEGLFEYWVAQDSLASRFYEACQQLEEYPEHTGEEVVFPLVDAADYYANEFDGEGFFENLIEARKRALAEEQDMGPKPLPCGGPNGEHWHEDCRACLELSLHCAARQNSLDFSTAQLNLL